MNKLKNENLEKHKEKCNVYMKKWISINQAVIAEKFEGEKNILSGSDYNTGDLFVFKIFILCISSFARVLMTVSKSALKRYLDF